MNDETARAIQALLTDAKRILVITHINPDGDAISSLTAMGLALRQLGKEPTLVSDDGCPARFDYLPLADKIQKYVDAHREYDLIVALDCGDMSRMGKAYADLPEPTAPILNIDHHVTNTRFGEVNLVDSDCVSTTEILHGLLPKLDVTITKPLATCLLTGTVTDTLGFRTVGVNADTFRSAAELMEAGANLAEITTRALLLKPLSTLRLWQVGLDNIKMEPEGVLWSSISNEQREAIGYAGSSSGGLVNKLANVDEATMSAVLIEEGDKVYVGFRCRPPFNVAELALNLGGGGHPLAAGCTLDGPLEKAESLVVSMARETIRQQQALIQADGSYQAVGKGDS